MIWTADVQLTRTNLSHSLPSHNSHFSQNLSTFSFSLSLSLRLMNRSVRISPDLGFYFHLISNP
ncbi:hypothetical protein Hanom_Chr16g01461121 [Helianthus anomalus]